MGRAECPYAERWTLETPFGSLRLHHWLTGDDPRALHDHPWSFVTIILSGGYADVTEHGRERMGPGRVRFRPAGHRHTVEVGKGGCWSLVITGPHTRFWGFWRKGRWVKSNRYFLEEGHPPCQ